MTVFYQVESSVASSGKRVAVTKRRVRWRWGVANENALATGATGVECRGSEHEVTLIWSITSGKRLVLLDGEEVHFSIGRRTEGKFQYSWGASALGALGTNLLTIIAYANTPLRSVPGFKQFDLIINGQSCLEMCHICELGVHENLTKNYELAVAGNSGYDTSTHPPTREEERQWVEQVIKLEQKRDMNQVRTTQPTRSQSLPIGALRETDSVVPPHSKSVTFAHDLLSESSVILNDGDLLSASLPVEINHYQTPSDDEFNPNRPPSYETIWSTIMDAYDSGSTNQVDKSSRYPAAEIEQWRNNETSSSQVDPALVDPTIHQIQAENIQNDNKNIQIQTDGIHNNSGGLCVQTKSNDYKNGHLQINTKDLYKKTAVTSPRDVSGIDEAMQNLVNMEDILSPVFNTKLTMNSNHNKENRGNQTINSRGLPPKMGSQRQFGRRLTLLEIKHQQSNQRIDRSKEIMKACTHHSTEQNPVAMVAYHQPQ